MPCWSQYAAATSSRSMCSSRSLTERWWKNMDSLMLRANTIDVNFPLAKARRFQLDHPMYANSCRWTLSMGRPASWYLWLQAVAVTWRGNVKPYWCLVSKCSLSGWKLLGKLRSYRFVPCGLGGSFHCWCCVCAWYALGGVLTWYCFECQESYGPMLPRHEVMVALKRRRNVKVSWWSLQYLLFWARGLLSETILKQRLLSEIKSKQIQTKSKQIQTKLY